MTLCVHQSQGLPVVLDGIIVYTTQYYYICWRADLSRDADVSVITRQASHHEVAQGKALTVHGMHYAVL